MGALAPTLRDRALARSLVRVGLATLLLLAAHPGAADAQTNGTGLIRGVIRDSAGRFIADASVVAGLDDGSYVRRVLTDQRGGFWISLLPPGFYNLTAQKVGFLPSITRLVIVEGNVATIINPTMTRKPVDLPEVATTAESSPVAMQKGAEAATTKISAEEIAALPVGTDIDRLIAMAPGARAGALWGAAGAAANSYQLDGMAINNPGIGGAFLQPSVRWIETLEIKGLGAGASEGNFQGGLVNVVTKSGSNTRRAAIEANVEHHALNGTSLQLTNLRPEIADRRQVIGQLSGPIARDRLFYYLGAEWLQGDYHNLDHLSTISSRALAPFLQTQTDTKLFGKLTVVPSGRDLINLSVAHGRQQVSHADFTGRETAEATTALSAPSTVLDAGWQRSLGTSTTIETKLIGFDGVERRDPYAGSSVPGIYTYQLATTRSYQNAPLTTDRHARSAGASLALDRYQALFGGQHHVRVGAEYSDGSWTDRRTRNGGMTWRPRYSTFDGSAVSFRPGDALTWQSQTPSTWGGEVDLAAHLVNGAMYAQDEMKVGQLTLFPGLRLGSWRGDIDPTAAGVSTRVTAVSDRALDPRLGATYELGSGERAFKVKAHWGRYHQAVFAELFDRAQGANAYTDQQVWEYSGPAFADPRTTFTLAERNALAAQGKFTQIEDVKLSQSGLVLDYRQPYVNQLVIGFEARPDAHWRGEVLFLQRDSRNLVALVDRNASSNHRLFQNVAVLDRRGHAVNDQDGNPLVLPQLYIQNDAIARFVAIARAGNLPFPPGITPADESLVYDPDYVLTNPPEARRRLGQWLFTLATEFPDWSASVSLAFSDLKGNFSTLTGYDALTTGGFEGITGHGPGPYVRPNEAVNDYGWLDNSSPLTLKARGFGRLGAGFRGGAAVEIITGDRITPNLTIVPGALDFRVQGQSLNSTLLLPLAGQRIYTTPLGDKHYAGRMIVDAHLERDFVTSWATWTLMADAFNLLGANDITLVNSSLNSDADPNALTRYATALATQPPRQIRLGAGVHW